MNDYSIIVVDSYRRDKGYSSTDFRYSLNRAVKDVQKIELLFCSFSNTFYTFNKAKLYVTESNTNNFTIDIPTCSFDVTEMETFLNTQFNLLSTTKGYVISYNESDFKFTFHNPGITFKIDWSKNDSPTFQFGALPLESPLSNTYTSFNSISFDSSDYVLISIEKVNTVITTKNAAASYIVPINVLRDQINEFNSNNGFTQVISTNNMDIFDLRIQLYDDAGRILECDECNLKLILKCHH